MDPSPAASEPVSVAPPESVRGLAVFMVVSFGLAWAAQISFAGLMRHLTSPAQAMTAKLLLAAPLMYPPAVGALLARRVVERGPLRDLGFAWPKPWSWLVAAWLLIPALIGITLLISIPLVGVDKELTRLTALLAATGKVMPASLTPARILLIQTVTALVIGPLFPNALATFGEELGWRGYLLPRLQSLLGPWPGLWAHGAVWGMWHAPLIVLTGYNYPHHPRLGVLMMTVFCMLLGVVLAWMQKGSGSILIPTLAHAGVNALAALPTFVLRPFDELGTGMLLSVTGCIVLALAVAAISRTRSFREKVIGSPPPQG